MSSCPPGLPHKLLGPHPRLDTAEHRRVARLLAALMLAHAAAVLTFLPFTHLASSELDRGPLWDDLAAWFIMGGAFLIIVAYGLLRAGRLRAGYLLYVGTTMAVALLVPFAPDGSGEIGLLASAVIPFLLATIALPTRALFWLMGFFVVAVSGLSLAMPVDPQATFTVIVLVIVVVVVGLLMMVTRAHFAASERDRVDRILAHEGALRKSEQRYRHLFETVTDGIFVADVQGILLEVNEAACEQLGYTRDELVGMSLSAVSGRSREQLGDSMARLREQGHAFYQTLHRRKDGGTVAVELAVTRIDYGDSPALLGVSRDISERQANEAHRRRLETQLQQKVKMESVGRLAGGVAHDFNNLLTTILGNADLALAELDAKSDSAGLVQDIRRAGESAASLTAQLLAFSRKQVLRPRVVDLNAMLERMTVMLRRLIGEDVRLEMVLGEALWLVDVDPAQIEQIVINLAVNARDAMPDGGTLLIDSRNLVCDADTDRHAEARPGEFVAITVTDTGVGMPEEIQRDIFEPFFTTKPKGLGTGLGLATTYGIVRQLEGWIEVESSPGEGSTLRVVLPRAAGDSPSDTPQAAEIIPTTARGETILIAEDAKQVRELAVRLLRREGYEVLAAASGEEALSIARGAEAPIALLLTDVVLPGINGRVLAERFTARHPTTRVLFTSGYTDDVIARHGVLEPGIDFIAKPYTHVNLVTKIREVLDAT